MGLRESTGLLACLHCLLTCWLASFLAYLAGSLLCLLTCWLGWLTCWLAGSLLAHAIAFALRLRLGLGDDQSLRLGLGLACWAGLRTQFRIVLKGSVFSEIEN